MIEILFILGFTIHNIEEALWLPEWSKYAGKYHQKISEDEFRFAVIGITAIGYIITLQYLLFSETSAVSRYSYLGFVSMMVLNTFSPPSAGYRCFKEIRSGFDYRRFVID